MQLSRQKADTTRRPRSLPRRIVEWAVLGAAFTIGGCQAGDRGCELFERHKIQRQTVSKSKVGEKRVRCSRFTPRLHNYNQYRDARRAVYNECERLEERGELGDQMGALLRVLLHVDSEGKARVVNVKSLMKTPEGIKTTPLNDRFDHNGVDKVLSKSSEFPENIRNCDLLIRWRVVHR